MAQRPAWTVKDGVVISENFEFVWNGGFAVSQKQKNIDALHESVRIRYNDTALEISTKSKVETGKRISAFVLKLSDIPLENIFQASKKYEKGGPYTDLLTVNPVDSKRDERHKNSGRLVAFVYNGETWPCEPKTLFYDYIYISALIGLYGENYDLSGYTWFTDIEFNPQKSINCQARSAAVYKLIQERKCFEVLKDIDSWTKFHREYVKG